MLYKQESCKNLTSSEQGPVSGSGNNENEYSDSMNGDGHLTTTIRFLQTVLRKLKTLLFNFLVIELALKYMNVMQKPEG
jgi:hypothetical protein